MICHPRAEFYVTSRCDIATSALQHNGEDAMCLAYGTEDNHVILDCVGDFRNQPDPNGFTVCGIEHATRDRTLRRKCDVVRGNQGDWNTSSSK